jgi:uncharacterized membrane protein YoaK (UPF0700 family)
MFKRLTNTFEAVLMLLTVSSGVVDAISFLTFGKVFTAFMTGNLVFLGIGAAGAFHPGGPDMPRVCIVIVAFTVGVYLASWLIRLSRRSRSSAYTVVVSLAGVLVVELIFLIGWIAAGSNPSGGVLTVLATIAAVAMGMQSAAVGALDVKGVFTTAVTATLINLSREAADRRVSDTDPARMARILVCLVAGAAVGGILLVHARPFAAAVPPLGTAGALALTVAHRRAQRRSTEPAIDGLSVVPTFGDAEAA